MSGVEVLFFVGTPIALYLNALIQRQQDAKSLVVQTPEERKSESDTKALTGAAPGVEVSPVNAVALRETTFGRYLESINTDGTWFQRVQETLGFQPTPFNALDAFYITTGVAGITLLAIPLAAGATLSTPVLIIGSTLTGLSALGMSEQDRAVKIGSGIAGGTLVLFQPRAATFVIKEAFRATGETAKQTIELAKTGIGLTTAALGLITAVVGAGAILAARRRRRSKRKSMHVK
jgi:hypothetical protein